MSVAGKSVARLLTVPLLAAMLSFAEVRAAGTPEEDHAAHQGGPVPREILDRPVPLRQGIGTMHQAVTTSSPQAQAFYDQGIAYLHSYVWIEAARSFHQALRQDPKLVMAYLGLTDTYIGLQDLTTARAAFQEAERLQMNASEKEKMWIEIRRAELEQLEDSGDPDKYVAYRHAVNEALKQNINDPWLWIQRGLADEGSPFTHGQAGGVDTLSFYKTALTYSPDNLAAIHYYAHTLENLGRAKEALEEASRYVKAAPAVPHAHHMHGHELMRLERTEEAIAEFLKTKELEEEYYRSEAIPPRYDWHHAHNLQLLAMSYQSLGQMKSAEANFRAAFGVPGYTEFLEFNRKAWPEFLLARGRYSDALQAAEELTKSAWPMARLAGYTLSGEALLGMGQISEAKDRLTLAEQETEKLPANSLATLPFPGILRAEILMRDGKAEEGGTLMTEIEQMILRRPGPDAWSAARFELEWVSRAARDGNDWELAESAAREIVHHAPSYAGGHYALALTAEHKGESTEARQQYAEAGRRWAKADSDLPELQRTRQASAALQ
jgi:tetratricopeptide (TPR) repeat protein